MAFQQKPLTGALFRNQDKQSPKHPDYNGSFTDEDGNEFWLSGWITESRKGVKFLNIKAKPKEAPQRSGRAEPIDDEDIPF